MRYSNRLPLLTACATILGLAGGGAAWVLLHLIGLITNLALFHQWGWHPPSFTELDPSPWIVVAAVGGGLAIATDLLAIRWRGATQQRVRGRAGRRAAPHRR